MTTFGKREKQNAVWFQSHFEELERIIAAQRTALLNYKKAPSELASAALKVPRPEASLIDRLDFQSGRADSGAGLRTRAYMLLPLFGTQIGMPVNLLAIVILSRGKCGLSTCTTRYLVAMATADLLVIITGVILWQISYYYFQGSFLYITPVCSVIGVLSFAAIDCSVWFTVTFTFDRFVAICCQKLKTKYCTKKTAAVVLATTCILFCLKNVPFYFTYEPGEIIDNVPWFCNTKPSSYTDPGWVGYDRFDMILTPLIPFALILLLNSLTVRHILVASRVRKGLRGQSKGENRSDPEMESRRKSVILLFTISGNFILLWLVYVTEFFYYNITGTEHRDYTDSEYIFQQIGWMLLNLSCCTNTFIYGATQSKFREQVKSAVKYPVKSIIHLMNKQNN
ncbi:probable G-protein coupled receptor 139 [Heterodontus francisci]|uniref:probable G-protein coupled receptor 139 n=1 Tax=Heterodontus francisci TaxID=7792 RepID=UPI00355BEDE5